MKESLKATSKILHLKKAKAQTDAIFGIKIEKITLYHSKLCSILHFAL